MARKRRNLYYRFTIIMLLFTGALLVYLFFNKITLYFNEEDRESNFTVYPGFGISLPDGFTVHGIDVSRYQKRINWPVVKLMKENDVRISFAFIKATEGLNFTDAQFKRNWRKLRENRIIRGAYHYMNTNGSGRMQAQHFINTVNLLPGDLPPVLDVETLGGVSPETLRIFVEEWLSTIESYYHVKPIIYSNAAFYNKYLGEKFSHYPLWVAHNLERHQPRVNREWQFWQHNEGGRVNGIDAFVDFNVFNGDSTRFNELLVK
jgi:lysozyme